MDMSSTEDKVVLTDIPNIEEILSGLKRTKHLEKYHVEFVNMLDLLKDARSIQERILSKWRETKTELSMKQEYVEKLEKEQSIEANTIETLKQDLATAFKNIEDSEKKDNLLTEEIEEQKTEILNLKSSLNEKEKTKWETTDLDIETIQEMKKLQSTVKSLKTELESSNTKLQTVEAALTEGLQLIRQRENELTSLKKDFEKELEKNVKADKTRLNAQKALKEKENVLNSLKGKITHLKKSCSLLESGVESHKLKVLHFQRRNKELHTLYKSGQKNLAVQSQNINALNQEKNNYLVKIKKSTEEIESLKEKVLNSDKSQGSTTHKILALKQQVKDSNLTIELLKSELTSSGKDMNVIVSKHAITGKQINYLRKEKEALENNTAKLEKLIQKHTADYKNVDKEKASLTQEVKDAEHQIEVHKHALYNYENIQQKLLKDIEDLKKKIEELKCKIDFHQDSADALKKANEILVKDYKSLHITGENTKSDLTLYYQWYKAAKDSLESLTNRLQDFNCKVTEVSQAAEKKNLVISGLMEALDKMTKKKVNLSENATELKATINSLKEKLKEQEILAKEQLHISLEKEKECEILGTKFKSATQNCGSLEAVLSEKNNMISELNSEAKKLESEVRKGEHRRMILENDIKQMKQELVNLCRDKTMLSEKLSKLEKLERVLNRTDKELDQERVKGSALETNMQHPWNIHRWRLLEGTDPERYNLIMKQSFLQKRLIHKTIEARAKEQELNEKEKEVEELQSLVNKQSVVENREKLTDLKWQLREKNDKIKVLSGQINMYESKLTSYQNEIAELREKLKNCKGMRLRRLRTGDSEKNKNCEYNLSD